MYVCMYIYTTEVHDCQDENALQTPPRALALLEYHILQETSMSKEDELQQARHRSCYIEKLEPTSRISSPR